MQLCGLVNRNYISHLFSALFLCLPSLFVLSLVIIATIVALLIFRTSIIVVNLTTFLGITLLSSILIPALLHIHLTMVLSLLV
jgi:hypothetical protein